MIILALVSVVVLIGILNVSIAKRSRKDPVKHPDTSVADAINNQTLAQETMTNSLANSVWSQSLFKDGQ